eukprot:403330981
MIILYYEHLLDPVEEFEYEFNRDLTYGGFFGLVLPMPLQYYLLKRYATGNTRGRFEVRTMKILAMFQIFSAVMNNRYQPQLKEITNKCAEKYLNHLDDEDIYNFEEYLMRKNHEQVKHFLSNPLNYLHYTMLFGCTQCQAIKDQIKSFSLSINQGTKQIENHDFKDETQTDIQQDTMNQDLSKSKPVM